MKIGIVGAGAIGGFFGVRLTQAGYEVSVLARGRNREILAEQGMTLTSSTGDATVKFAAVEEDPAAIGIMDVVIFIVKSQDSVQAAEDMKPMIGPNTQIISFQNGLFGIEHLAETFGADKVSPGITYIPAVVDRPGLVRHTGPLTRSLFGPYTQRDFSLHQELADALTKVGMDIHARAEPMPEIWEKFVVLSPFHVIGCLTRMPLGGWIPSPETEDLFLRAMKEVMAVSLAKGVAITPDIAEKQVAFCKTDASPDTRASMLEDLERGKPLEIDATIGWLCREGKRLGVPTPIHDTGYALLAPYRNGGRL